MNRNTPNRLAIFFGGLGILVAGLFVLVGGLKDSTGTEVASCPIKKTHILVDQTVDNKQVAISKLEEVMTRILEEAQKSPKSYMNAVVELSTIDDKGEHSSQWRVNFPASLGVQRQNLRKSMSSLREKYKATKAMIEADHATYSRSLLVEPISRALKGLGECDHLIVISDMCVVDGQENQHEAGRFGTPPDLKSLSKARVTFKEFRIERSGQKKALIDLIEAWWDDAFSGTRNFKQKYDAKEDAERAAADSLVRMKFAKVMKQNEVIVSRRAQAFRDCLAAAKRSNGRNDVYGSYRFNIGVSANGRSKYVRLTQGPSGSLATCVRDVLGGIRYVKSKTGNYVFDQDFRFGG